MFTRPLYAIQVLDSIPAAASELERSVLAAMLREAGHVIFEARDGPGGVRGILDKSPDLLVMAEEAPPANGTDYLPFARPLTKAPIAVAGWGGESRLRTALFQGGDAYVTRPLQDSLFPARFNSLLRRKRFRTSRVAWNMLPGATIPSICRIGSQT